MLDTIIHKEFSFTKKNDQNWVLEHSDKYFVVSDSIKSLLDILKRNNFDYTLAYNDFITEFDYVDQPTFQEIVNKNLKNLELDQDDNHQAKEKSFILFETKLLDAKKAAKVSKIIQPLYQPTFFWIVLTILFTLSVYNLSTMHHFHLGKESMILMLVIYLVSAFIHELGHIAACNRFTKKNGEIGFGIYFIFPVFYSNITPIWSATKQQRIITNLAGIYIQLYLIALLYILNLFINNHDLSDIIGLSTIIILYQLIPFIRTDGYWILSDLTESPNLLPNSSKKVNEFIKNPFKINLATRKDKLEFVYGIFNYLVMIYIITNIIINYKQRLFLIPYEFIKTLLTTPKEIGSYFSENAEPLLISIVFYFILYNLIQRFLPKNK